MIQGLPRQQGPKQNHLFSKLEAKMTLDMLRLKIFVKKT